MDLSTLVKWLGPEGAKAGLARSNLPVQELVRIAKEMRLPISSKPSREELANELVYHNIKKLQKKPDYLAQMPSEELRSYLHARKPSRTELIQILSELGVKVGSEASKRLLEFAVGEISDLGMYQRVARGTRNDDGS